MKKTKCEHENLEIIRDLNSGKSVTSCRDCERIWRDGGKKFRNEFEVKDPEGGVE